MVHRLYDLHWFQSYGGKRDSSRLHLGSAMRVALQDVIVHNVKRHTEGTGRIHIVSACKNHENVVACDIHSICTGEMQCLINHRIDQSYLYKGLRPVGQENPSTGQCKVVNRRQKADMRHGFAH